jgi:zinc protease
MIKNMSIALLFILATFALADKSDAFTFKLPKYSYHKFSNGFELIMVENHTNPLIATVVVIRTGLRNETPENNGVSHMLEHMTFNGTESRTQKQLYDDLDYYGIYLNAQTSEDYTTFMALNHKDQNRNTLEIISDMLFHSNFPAEKFEKEKGIIAEEIRKDSENPDFQKEVKLRRAFYQHPPYSMPVIGTVETVRNMTREQVIQYYQTYYSANNMIAIVIGDFSPKEMLNEMKQYFGKDSAKEIPKRQIKLVQKFPFVYIENESENEQTIYLKLPAPTFYSAGYIPFHFILSSEFDRWNGKFIQELKQNKNLEIKKIDSEYEYHPEFAFLTLKITTPDSIDTDDILKSATAILDSLKYTEIPADEIAVTKRQEAISEILQTEKIMYYGFLKAQALAIGGKDAFEKTIPAVLQIKDQAINDFLHTFARSYQSPKKMFKPENWAKNINLKSYEQRTTTGEVGKGEIYRHVFQNGLTVLELCNTDNSVLAMHFLFKNRSAFEPASQTGIADFLHHSLFKSSKNFSREEMQYQIKNIGAEIKAYDWDFIPYDDYYNVPEYSYIRFVTLDQFFEEALILASDNILYPNLDTVFSETKSQMEQLAARKEKSASEAAKLGFLRLALGEDNPLTKPVSGTTSSIENITPEDLKNFHQQYFSAGNTILSIVSSQDSATVFGAVEKYFNEMPLLRQEIILPEIPLTESVKKDSAEIGTRQAYIELGYVFDALTENYLALQMMNGMLNDQITFSLREQKGWAYRLGSSVERLEDKFLLNISMGTGRETTSPAIQGILDEITKFKEQEINEHLVEQTKNSRIAALVRRRASRENQAFVLGTNEFYGYSPAYFYSIFDDIKEVTLNSIVDARNKYLQNDIYDLFYTIPTGQMEQDKKMMGMPPHMGK